MRISQNEANELIFKLEERKYGRKLNSEELAEKAGVPLDEVNRVENQLPIRSEEIEKSIANALGITTDLLRKLDGVEEVSTTEMNELRQCVAAEGNYVPSRCSQVGLKQLF